MTHPHGPAVGLHTPYATHPHTPYGAHTPTPYATQPLVSQAHIVVATPGRLTAHLSTAGVLPMRRLRFLVADEVDRLMRQSYNQWLTHVLTAIEEQQHAGVVVMFFYQCWLSIGILLYCICLLSCETLFNVRNGTLAIGGMGTIRFPANKQQYTIVIIIMLC